MPTLLRPALATAVLAALATLPSSSRAEASHHAPASGQIVSPALIGDARVLTDPQPPSWDLWLFPSVLVSSRAFDDDGMRSSLVGAERITLAALNAYAERRLGAAWAISAATSFQRIEARGPAGTTSISDLGDSFVSARHSEAFSFGNLSFAAIVKIPGTYPDTALTSSKQVDAEGRVIFARQIGARVTFAGGAGYKLRLGDVEDEVTTYAAVPVRLAQAWTITGTLAAGIPIGAGEVAKNAVIPGVSLEWETARRFKLSGSYQRTVYGRNVTDADVFALGVGREF